MRNRKTRSIIILIIKQSNKTAETVRLDKKTRAKYELSTGNTFWIQRHKQFESKRMEEAIIQAETIRKLE